MNAKLADEVRPAMEQARRLAIAFSGPASGDDLPWAVIAGFDTDVRGHVERDRRIEEERDRVLIAAVNLAETRAEDGPEAIEAARTHLIDAIDYLEQAVLRFGIMSARAAKRGLGDGGLGVAAKV